MMLAEKNNRWGALIIVLSAPLLSVIDVFIINVAIPAIRAGVHASEGEVQLVIASYLLGYAAFLVTGGRFGDHFGKKKVFVWAMACFTLMSCWCGSAHSATELNVARFFQGVSAAFMVPQTISYIQLLFVAHKDRAKAVGLFGITLGIASMLGQFLGGLLTYFHFFIAGWRLIFFINLPIGLLAVVAAMFLLPETKIVVAKKFDITGVLTLTFALFCLILPLVQGREYGWPWWSWLTLGISVILFTVFLKDQRQKKKRGQPALIDVGLFSFRDFNIGLLCVMCCFVVHNSYLLTSTLLFQNGFRFNAYLTGKIFVLFGLGFTVSSLYSIRLISRLGKRVVQLGVLIMFLAICLQLIFFQTATVPLPVICLLVALHGIGAGMVLPSIMNVTLKNVPHDYAGAASGLYTTAQQASSALGVSLIGGLFFSILDQQYDFEHYQRAFSFSSCANLFTLAVMSVLLIILPGGISTTTHLSE